MYRLARPDQAADSVTERRLMWASVIASELPDSDMISTFFGDAAGLLLHRTYTHSIPGILVLTLALSLMLMKFWTGIPRRRLWGLVLCGGLLHSFFDLLTSYGTKVLLPWRDTPYGWDVLPIIDPYLLVLLALFVWTSRRYSSKVVLWGLVLLMVGYIGWRGHLHDKVLAIVRGAFPSAQAAVVSPVIYG
jgi:inner membrane protein